MAYYGGDHWVYFGDGNAAQIIDSREYTRKDDGIKYTRFILLPSRMIEQMYAIEEEQDDEGLIVREYESIQVLWLQRSVNRTRCWIFVNVQGEETAASNLNKHFTEAILDSQRLIRSAEAAKNRMFQELQKERTQKAEALKMQTNIIKEIAKARGRTDDEGGLGQYDGGME
jgi:hypothetical protein